MENISVKLACLVIIFLPLTLQAETFMECSEIESSSERLTCYDAVATRLKATDRQLTLCDGVNLSVGAQQRRH